MESVFSIIIGILAAYLIGSFPTSFVLGKALKGIDIRQFGSGNVGATNVLRVIGKAPAAIALAVDILKGVLVVTLIACRFYPAAGNIDYVSYRAIMGFIAICGHIWPVFLKFRGGGKGVATTVGVAAVIAPWPFLLSGAIWLTAFFITNYVSAASIALGVTFPIFAAILNQPFSVITFAVLVGSLSIYKHKGNIERLLKGEEHKTYIFEKR